MNIVVIEIPSSVSNKTKTDRLKSLNVLESSDLVVPRLKVYFQDTFLNGKRISYFLLSLKRLISIGCQKSNQ